MLSSGSPSCLLHRDTAADFIAAHRLSDVLLKVSLDETKRSTLGLGAVQAGGECGWPTELRTGPSSVSRVGSSSVRQTVVLLWLFFSGEVGVLLVMW